MAYDLSKHLTVCLYGEHWAPLSSAEFTRFHTDAYVKFLQTVHVADSRAPEMARPDAPVCASAQLEHNGADVVNEATSYALNASVCFSESAW